MKVLIMPVLIIACMVGRVPPGQPVTLSVEKVGSTWVQITWETPRSIDFPITRYEVIARADVILRNMSTPNNNTFVNVTDLLPGTDYNFTVVAVIEAGEVVARSVESASLGGIVTGFTVPNITCPRPVSSNGNIMATWSYVHTGGLPLTRLSVMYSYEVGVSTVTRSVGVSLAIDDLMVTVSGLVAGEEYTFTVTAENSNGSSSTACEPVNHIIGVPAAPQFGELTTGPYSGVITVQIKTVASGINQPDQDFRFNIIPVFALNKQPERIYEFPNYMSGQFVSIAVGQLEPGESYTFSATAMNIFGSSTSANSPVQFAGGDSLPPPPTPTRDPGGQPSDKTSANGTTIAIGVTIPVLVLAIILTIAVVVILVFSGRRSKGTINESANEKSNELESSVPKECPAYKNLIKKDTGVELVQEQYPVHKQSSI